METNSPSICSRYRIPMIWLFLCVCLIEGIGFFALGDTEGASLQALSEARRLLFVQPFFGPFADRSCDVVVDRSFTKYAVSIVCLLAVAVPAVDRKVSPELAAMAILLWTVLGLSRVYCGAF